MKICLTFSNPLSEIIMQERFASTIISDNLRQYIEAIIEEVVIEGKPFDRQKKYLQRFCNSEGLDFALLNKNLTSFFETMSEISSCSKAVISRLVPLLCRECLLGDGEIEQFLQAFDKHGATATESEDEARRDQETEVENSRMSLAGNTSLKKAIPVDLGLPSGTKWADRDVEGFYSWGEVQDKEEEGFSFENYVHCDGDRNSMHRIGNNICGTQFDVAHIKWGERWRMPTIEQIEELIDNCTIEWEEGGDFCKATSLINGNHLWFRIVGIGDGEGFFDGVIFWSGNVGSLEDEAKCLFLFGDADSELAELCEEKRYLGGRVRAVMIQ